MSVAAGHDRRHESYPALIPPVIAWSLMLRSRLAGLPSWSGHSRRRPRSCTIACSDPTKHANRGDFVYTPVLHTRWDPRGIVMCHPAPLASLHEKILSSRAVNVEKGSVESTHKVTTSHYHTKHCHVGGRAARWTHTPARIVANCEGQRPSTVKGSRPSGNRIRMFDSCE